MVLSSASSALVTGLFGYDYWNREAWFKEKNALLLPLMLWHFNRFASTFLDRASWLKKCDSFGYLYSDVMLPPRRLSKKLVFFLHRTLRVKEASEAGRRERERSLGRFFYMLREILRGWFSLLRPSWPGVAAGKVGKKNFFCYIEYSSWRRRVRMVGGKESVD